MKALDCKRSGAFFFCRKFRILSYPVQYRGGDDYDG